MPKVLSYEDKMYQNQDPSKVVYDCLYQAFLDLKAEKRHGGWNLPVMEQGGVTMKFLGEGKFCVTYHRVETGTIEEIAKNKQTSGKDYLKIFVNELKKKFKAETKQSLKLNIIDESQLTDPMQHTYADTSWMLGSNRAGYRGRPTYKFLIRDTNTYSFETE